MIKEEYNEIISSIIEKLENSKYMLIDVETIEISSDIGDIGNEIGIAIGKHIVDKELDKGDFITGIKHGISLMDGTH